MSLDDFKKRECNEEQVFVGENLCVVNAIY